MAVWSSRSSSAYFGHQKTKSLGSNALVAEEVRFESCGVAKLLTQSAIGPLQRKLLFDAEYLLNGVRNAKVNMRNLNQAAMLLQIQAWGPMK
jgi:hypothetical protein